MTIQDIKDIIAGVGFPIFVAVYLLLKIEPAMRRLTEVIEKLCLTLTGPAPTIKN